MQCPKAVIIRSLILTLSLWWGYLFFTSEFVVVFDSGSYEGSGRIIAHQGWAEFLRQGPGREPLFPALVALSMRLADWWGVSYHYPLKLIGILFLAATLFFSFRLMRMMRIGFLAACLGVFYMGLSPTLSTSSMRLWSEFAAYPWVILAVIWSIKSWEYLKEGPEEKLTNLKIIGHAVMVAAMFLMILSVKAIIEGVLLLFLWPFYWQVFSCWRQRNFVKARQWAVFCLAVVLVFEGAACAYRACNYHYNGQFAVTDRGDWALYGNTARRMQPMTFKRVEAAIVSVSPLENCWAILPVDDCNFWTARYSDDLIDKKRGELRSQGVKDRSASRYFIESSLKMILANPLQAIGLMAIEAHEMFFWEPISAFEVYPDWLEGILHSMVFFKTMMNVMAALTWMAFAASFVYLWRRRGDIELTNKHRTGLFWVFNFIFWYMALYSLYFILDRYAFPIVALYVILIVFWIDKIIKAIVK